MRRRSRQTESGRPVPLHPTRRSKWTSSDPPAGAAPALVTRLHADIVKALATPELRDRLQAQGLEPVGDSPQAFAAYVKQQIAQWTKVIRDAGIKVE